MTVNRHVIVRGRVQGVGFRAFVEYEATSRKLRGWVRNRRDGSVEAVLSGSEKMVEEMLDACRKGPPGSRVDGLDVNDASPPEGAPPGQFAVLPTI